MKNLWSYDKQGQCVVKDARSLKQPLIHMIANCPKYFSICDNFLRGFSGFDYTRMFGEFDGPNFPKGQARFIWIREGNQTWLVNNYDLTDKQTSNPKYEMGLGYVNFYGSSKKLNLDVKTTIFVPLEEMAELWLVNITNNSKKDKVIDFIPTVPIYGGSRAYVEYHRDVVRLYNKSEVKNSIKILPGLEVIFVIL